MVAKRISLEDYSSRLTTECNRVYDIVKVAKSRGLDPKLDIEIPQAIDLSERTQKLLKFLHDRNTAQQIRELTKVHDENRELVALDIARIVCAESYLGALVVLSVVEGPLERFLRLTGWHRRLRLLLLLILGLSFYHLWV